MNHIEFRKVVIVGFDRQFPDVEPTLTVYQSLQGVCGLESGYGTWWKLDGRESNNMGAVQGGRPPCNLSTSFQYTDTHPNDDGTSTPYSICFKKYATPEDGVADVARIMFREFHGKRPALDAALHGDLYGVSAAMHAQSYYEGWGPTVADRIRHHYEALKNAVRRAAMAIGEPMPGTTEVPRPTIRRGSHGESVRTWQMFLNEALPEEEPLVADGAFGKFTERRTMVVQRKHGLHPDGVVGPKSWRLADG